jgi:hypothetical protein
LPQPEPASPNVSRARQNATGVDLRVIMKKRGFIGGQRGAVKQRIDQEGRDYAAAAAEVSS